MMPRAGSRRCCICSTSTSVSRSKWSCDHFFTAGKNRAWWAHERQSFKGIRLGSNWPYTNGYLKSCQLDGLLMLRCCATPLTRRSFHCRSTALGSKKLALLACPIRMSAFTTRPLRGREIKKPLSTSTCWANETVLRDTPKASASARLVGTLAPGGTSPIRMLWIIISLTRPCKVLLLLANCGNSLTQMPVTSCLFRMGDLSAWRTVNAGKPNEGGRSVYAVDR